MLRSFLCSVEIGSPLDVSFEDFGVAHAPVDAAVAADDGGDSRDDEVVGESGGEKDDSLRVFPSDSVRSLAGAVSWLDDVR